MLNAGGTCYWVGAVVYAGTAVQTPISPARQIGAVLLYPGKAGLAADCIVRIPDVQFQYNFVRLKAVDPGLYGKDGGLDHWPVTADTNLKWLKGS